MPRKKKEKYRKGVTTTMGPALASLSSVIPGKTSKVGQEKPHRSEQLRQQRTAMTAKTPNTL